MINQEEYLHHQPSSNQINYFIDNLLQQPNIDDELFPPLHPQAIKQSSPQSPPDSDSQLHSPMSINILEKQQCHSFPPQRFFEYVGDDVVEEVEESQQKSFEQEIIQTKKPEKINKLSYLEETRATKIQRYKSKKTRRIWNRKISYDCRKIVADNRERVNGRFVKKSPINPTAQSLNHSNSKTKDVQTLRQVVDPEVTFYDFNL